MHQFLKVIKGTSLIFTLLIISHHISAQDFKINVDELMSETQFMSEDPDLMKMSWYIPIEYWKAVFANDESISEQEIKDIIDILDDYETFAVLDGTFGVFGNIKYKTKGDIKRGITLVSPEGETYYPLDESEISSEANSLIMLMQPVLSSMMGNLGENMHFFFFKGKAKNQRLIDPTKVGTYTINISEEPFTYEFPLASLLPPKFCPKDGKKMKGTWKYCPFHGVELGDN